MAVFWCRVPATYHQGRFTIDALDAAQVPCLRDFSAAVWVRPGLVFDSQDRQGLLIVRNAADLGSGTISISLLQQLADQVGIALVQLLAEESSQRREPFSTGWNVAYVCLPRPARPAENGDGPATAAATLQRQAG